MGTAYDGRQVVGMDLHRRRSVLVRMTEDGRRLGTARITNSAAELRKAIAAAGANPRVVLEATYGWYWAADVLAAAGAEVHLAHPLGVKAFSYRRVKNDEKDSADLADPLPAQAGPAPQRFQGAGARAAGQAGHPGHLLGHLRGGGEHLAR
jgi:transposase